MGGSALPRARGAALLACVLVAVTQALYVAATGIALGGDSATYGRWADILIRRGFHYGRFIEDVAPVYPPTFYVAWGTVLALCKLVFGAHWQVALVTLNVVAASVTAAMIGALAQRCACSFRAGLAAAVMACAAFDLFSWNRYVLSDATFVLLVVAAFALLADALLGGSSARRAIVASIVIAGVAVLYRPTAVAMLPVLALGWLLVSTRERVISAVERRPQLIAAGGVSIVLVVAAGFLVFARLMQHPDLWPVGPGSGAVRFTAGRFLAGEVMWDRPDTFHAPPETYLDYVRLVLDRFSHFFYFSNAAFSSAHKVGAALFYVPVYAFAVKAVAMATSRRSDAVGAARLTVALAAALVLATVAFHGMVQVDFDWRYRAPVMPHLILLAAIGVSPSLGRGARDRRRGAP